VQIIGRSTRDAPGKERARFTNLIAEPDAAESLVVEAVNDTLKAIAASLLMEQVLNPKFDFKAKDSGEQEGFDYGEGGYVTGQTNVGINHETGEVHMEIKGLVEPTSPEAQRICKEDLQELVTAFVQDKSTLEKGLFDQENTLPQELTQLKMGKIVQERYPELSELDQEAIRQRVVAALTLTQQGKKMARDSSDGELKLNTSLIDGIRMYAMSVKELEIDLIDKINPFETAYSVLAKTMNESTLKQVQATIAARNPTISKEDARSYAERALEFQRERGRLPAINAADPWEKLLAEGLAAFGRYKALEKRGDSS
jgi:hypothetical protein